MIHFKNFKTLLIIFIFPFFLTNCSKLADNNPTAISDPKIPPTITIGIMPDVESIPFVLAEHKGYFDEENVNVNLEIFKSAHDRDSALQGKQLDGIITDMVAVSFARSSGIPLKIIAKTDGIILLLAAPGNNITKVSDLLGKDIALSTNTIMDYSLDTMLSKNGLSPSSIEKISIPQIPARLEMLLNHQLSAAILPQPLASIAQNNGASVLMTTDDLGEKAGVIAFTEESIKEKSNSILAVFRAYNKAIADLNKSENNEYNDFIITTLNFPENLKGAIPMPIYSNAQLPNNIIFSHVMNWMTSSQLIETPIPWEDASDPLLNQLYDGD